MSSKDRPRALLDLAFPGRRLRYVAPSRTVVSRPSRWVPKLRIRPVFSELGAPPRASLTIAEPPPRRPFKSGWRGVGQRFYDCGPAQLGFDAHPGGRPPVGNVHYPYRMRSPRRLTALIPFSRPTWEHRYYGEHEEG